MKRRVVVLAGETEARAAIANLLRGTGYAVELASRPGRVEELVRRGKLYAAIIVLTSHERSDIAFLQKLTTTLSRIIVLTNRLSDQKTVKRAVPEVHVASYPIDTRLLTLLNNEQSGGAAEAEPPEPLARFAGWTLDFSERLLSSAEGREAALTRAEFAVLTALLRTPGRVVSRQRLRQSVDGRVLDADDRSIDMLVGRLRRKIEQNPAKPRLIVTIPSVGYKIVPEGGVAWTTARSRQAFEGDAATQAPERRQITAAFGQIVGLDALSRELDPEDLKSIVDAIRQDCARVLARHGGTLVSLLGDSIFIYFGFPEAREDDARRAVRAGLELIERVEAVARTTERSLRLQIGMATGGVVIEKTASSGVAAIGEAPTIARSLATVASPGTLVISERTRQLAGGFFVYEPVAPPGVDADTAVAAWRVKTLAEVTDRFAAATPVLAPLAGRREELSLLRRRWSQARSGRGQIVLINADAGMGKSRLILELKEKLQLDAAFVLRFFGSPYQADTPLSVARDELERAAHIASSDPGHVRVRKLRQLLDRGRGLDEEVFASLSDLLALPVPGRSGIALSNPRRRKEKTLAALLRRVEVLVARSPTLILVEDAQWIDPTSLEFLTRLVDQAASWRVMVLITARPEFAPPWHRHSHVSTIALSNLSRAASISLVQGIAEQHTPSPDLVNAIVARSDGVPLFIEELTRAVLEAGSHAGTDTAGGADGLNPSQRIPQTLHGSLLARLDRLGDAKEIAQVAAVAGREFSHDMLQRMAPPSLPLDVALETLVSSGLVLVRGTTPLATYVFKHALVRDAAYEILLRGRRKELHAAAARFLEEQQSEAGAPIELLAYHYERSDQPDIAATHHIGAAEHALERAGLSEALGHLERAERLLGVTAPSERRLQLELKLYVTRGRALIARCGYSAPETREAHRQAWARCSAAGHKSASPPIHFGLWLSAWNAAEYDTALAIARELRASGEQNGQPGVTGVAHMALGMTLALTGDLVAARVHLARALQINHFALPDQPAHFFPAVNGRIASTTYLHDCLLLLGRPEDADRMARKAETVFKGAQTPALHQSYSYALAQNHLLRMYVLRGDVEKAKGLSSELLRLSAQQDYPYFHGTSAIYTGWISARAGNPLDAVALWQRGMGQLREIGARCWLPRYLALLAEYHARIGDVKRGLEAITEAHDVISKTNERIWEAEVYRLQGQLLMQTRGGRSRAQRCFEEALQIAKSQRAKLFEQRAVTCLTELSNRSRRRSRT